MMKISKKEILQKLKPVDPKSHKGILGHALIIGGSHGKIGSVCLASKSALRTGCGLVTAFLPECGYPVVQSYVPEVMAITDVNERNISRIDFEIAPNAIGIGPGMGTELVTQKAFHDFLKHNRVPIVIDADALNILSLNKKWMELLPENSILTPHPKEFERLIGKIKPGKQQMEAAQHFSKRYKIILVLKGAPTIVINRNEVFENSTGNPALATAGSGDVLTGIITSLLAQSYSPIDAAIVGVYLHGLAADIALPTTGTQSFIASDIIDNIGKAYLSLQK